MAYPAPGGDEPTGTQGTVQGQAPPPDNGQGYPIASGTDVGGGSSGATITSIPKLVMVGALLLVLLLLLANHFPKFTTGFMLLVLTGVVVTHSSIITRFFNTNG